MIRSARARRPGGQWRQRMRRKEERRLREEGGRKFDQVMHANVLTCMASITAPPPPQPRAAPPQLTRLHGQSVLLHPHVVGPDRVDQVHKGKTAAGASEAEPAAVQRVGNEAGERLQGGRGERGGLGAGLGGSVRQKGGRQPRTPVRQSWQQSRESAIKLVKHFRGGGGRRGG